MLRVARSRTMPFALAALAAMLVVRLRGPRAGLLIGAGLLLVVVWLFRRRAVEAEYERARIEAVAVKAREILAGTPDGLFIWDRGSEAVT